MTAEQLEEMLGKVTQGEWLAHEVSASGLPTSSIMADDGYTVAKAVGVINPEETQSNATLIALAPSLARRVIAAEKLVEALRITRERLSRLAHSEFDGVWNDKDFAGLTTESDEALAEWEAEQ